MLRWIIALLMVAGLATTVGCTKSSDDRDSGLESSQEDGDFDDESDEIAEEDDEGFEDDEGEEGFEDEEEDFADEDVEEDEEFDGEEVADEDAESDEELDGGGDEEGDEEVVADDGGEEDGGEEFASAEETQPDQAAMSAGNEALPDEAFDEVPMAAPIEEKPVKKYIPVKKIAEFPFERNGQNLNTVYIAREGDTMDDISEKIYGSTARKSDLLDANPTLRRKLKVGDKVYYNSPNRPSDTDRVITYYEDAGVPAETYNASAGENIREISEKLLGNSRSWMEVWATNPNVDSKWDLSTPTELRYWPKGATGMGGPESGDMAMEAAPPSDSLPEKVPEPEPMPEPVPEPVAEPIQPVPNDPMGQPMPAPDVAQPMEPAPSEPPPTQANNNPPPPPPPPVESPPPPPAESVSAAPPPPPPPPPPTPRKRAKRSKKKKSSGGFMDSIMGKDSSENLLLAAGVLTLGLAGALILIRRKRKAKRIEFTDGDDA